MIILLFFCFVLANADLVTIKGSEEMDPLTNKHLDLPPTDRLYKALPGRHHR